MVKIESTYSSGVTCANGASALIPSHAAELHFLRSRVRELEREKAELSTDNQRLRNMLVHGESMITGDQSDKLSHDDLICDSSKSG